MQLTSTPPYGKYFDFVFIYLFLTYCHSSYARMYKDVRAAVDLCHRDGTLKQMVAKDPGRYEYKIITLSK